jgi:hypothetical protein
VVDRGGLENRCTREGTVGSNPTPSAMTRTRRARGPFELGPVAGAADGAPVRRRAWGFGLGTGACFAGP